MQIRLQTALLSMGLATLGCWATPARADEWNKRTTFTFHQAVEVPGHVLTPGRYVFQLADLQADRDVVQVFSEDKRGMDHLVTTTLTVPDYRLKTPEKPIITFEERHINTPEAVHSWFYPGDNYGWEFVYPKAQRLQVAASASAPPAPPSQPVQVAAPAPEPAPQPVTVAQNHPPAPQAAPAPAPTLAPAPKILPKTASDLPLDGAAGVFLIALGFGVLASRRCVRA